ncbi:MAG: Holliday junction branch migration protein RuvA [Candidatus Zhuqueibacterota bacterium]
MIHFLQGILVDKSPTKAVLDVQGVGFELNITLPCFENLAEIGQTAHIITYLHVREDILQLYGFSSRAERELFLQLIGTPGIGPKKAQAILSSVTVDLFQRYIIEEDLNALTSLSGVGKKTAQRLILDLKDKISLLPLTGQAVLPERKVTELDRLIDDALLALTSLGFNKNSAQTAIQKVLQQTDGRLALEEVIKQALRLL